jgi:hypothetical protein
MSSVKKIVCLANSWKNQERCIAGIDLDTGNWIRPVCGQRPYDNDGRVPRNIRLVEGKEPELLDILEIPLADTGENFGFESENLTILAGQWKLVGKAEPKDLYQYCFNYPHILHNLHKYVKESDLKSLPFENRRTLQLTYVEKFDVKPQKNENGLTKWKGTLENTSGQRLVEVAITDPAFIAKLEAGYQTQGNYLVTVSLGMPGQYIGWEEENYCWKLIAGVIEIDEPPN